MRVRLTVGGAQKRDVEISAPPETPTATVLAALGIASGLASVGGRSVNASATFADSGLVEGAVVTPDLAGSADGTAADGVQLTITAGPERGRVVALGAGTHVVGRGRTATVQVVDEELSRQHFSIEVSSDAVRITDLGSTNGTFVNGDRADNEPLALSNGSTISAGLSAFEVSIPEDLSRAVLVPDHAGGFVLTRAFRILRHLQPVEIAWPLPPQPDRKRPFPWPAAIIPLVLGIVIALVTRKWMFLLLTLMSPVSVIATQYMERRNAKSSSEEDKRKYEERKARAEADLQQRLSEERAYRATLWPDQRTVTQAALAPSSHLWERRPTDPDFLNLRVGIADLPALVTLRASGGDPEAVPPQPRVKATGHGINLLDAGIVGIAGQVPTRQAMLEWIAVQLVTLHAAEDVRLVLLQGLQSQTDLSFLRWAPHLRDDDGLVALSLSPEITEGLIRALQAVVDARKTEQTQTFGSSVRPTPSYVVLLEGAAELRRRPEVASLLQRGPGVGVYFVCFDESAALLPEECRAVVTLSGSRDNPVALVKDENGKEVSAIADGALSADVRDSVVRAIAPIRRVDGGAGPGALPQSVSLLEAVELPEPSAEQVVARWRTSGRSSRAVVGVAADGPFYFDLVKDGPHGLIAGTTGSGKSEFIQSLVVSLALANRPDELAFVLMDYKGGASALVLRGLPHVVGEVSNLDGRLAQRALESLGAEIKRRQLLFSKVGASDLDGYNRIKQDRPELEQLPRLVIVVDEFSEMKQQLPDFIDGLVSLVRLGRSLGVHLFLATQRPSGAVSPDIRANSNARVCLRVQTDTDSLDVLEASDAARISAATPGRAIMRSGNTAPLRTFQSAYATGRSALGRDEAKRVLVRELPLTSWVTPNESAGHASGGLTDLELLVAAIADAAKLIDLAPVATPWTDPLPTSLKLDSLSRSSDDRLIVGLQDSPATQKHDELIVSLSEPLVVIGSPRSGRTTLVRTLIAASIQAPDWATRHFYVLDGGSALASLARVPVVGAVASTAQTERIGRLLAKFDSELSRRIDLLALSDCSDYAEYRARSSSELPRLVLVIDRWESVADDLSTYEFEDTVLRLISEGPRVGVTVVVTGDDSLLRTKLPSRAPSVVIMHLNDSTPAFALGVSGVVANATTSFPAGRGILVKGESELQFAVLADGSGAAEAAELDHLVARLHSAEYLQPFRVAPIPLTVSQDALAGIATKENLPLGVGGNDGQALTVRITDGLLIAGPQRSGRSTTLLTLARQATLAGLTVGVVCPRRSPLMEFASATVATDGQGSPADVIDSLKAVDLVLLDDVDTLLQGQLLPPMLTDPQFPPIFAAVDIEVPGLMNPNFRSLLKRSSQVLAICPPDHLAAQNVGVRIARGAGFSGPPGRAILALRGENTLMQVAL